MTGSLHIAKYSQGSSVVTYIRISFLLGLNNIPLYIDSLHFICWWTLGLLPFLGYCDWHVVLCIEDTSQTLQPHSGSICPIWLLLENWPLSSPKISCHWHQAPYTLLGTVLTSYFPRLLSLQMSPFPPSFRPSKITTFFPLISSSTLKLLTTRSLFHSKPFCWISLALPLPSFSWNVVNYKILL